MKYSTSHLASNLIIEKLIRQNDITVKGIIAEKPELLPILESGTITDTSKLEHFWLIVSLSNLIEINFYLKRAKTFYIDSEFAEHFLKKKYIKQDFNLTIKIPFERVFVQFEDPIEYEIGIPNDFEKFTRMKTDVWLKSNADEINKNIVIVKDKIFGLLIIHDEEGFREKIERTIDVYHKSGGKSLAKEFYDYYSRMNPKTSYKVYFITDMNKSLHEFQNMTEKEKEDYEKYIKSGNFYEHTNLIFDTNLLPELVSEFEIFKLTLEGKNVTKIGETLVKLMNLVINLINFMNSNQTVDVIPMWKSNKKKMKYYKKHNKQLPPNFYILKVKYPKEVVIGGKKGQPKEAYSYQFDVRGHFRTLRSEKFKNKRGQIIWIEPFIKGKGIYIPKSYAIDSKKDVVNDYDWENA